MLEIFWRKKTYQVKSEIDAFVDIDAYAEIEKNHAKLQDENKRLKEIIAEAKICAASLCIADLPSLKGLKEICIILNRGVELGDIRQALKEI